MIISIEAEKAFNEIQHTFMIKFSANYTQKECFPLDKEHIKKKS